MMAAPNFRAIRLKYGLRSAWPAALAAITSRVEVGPLVASTSFHDPAMLAVKANAVDEISGGRLILGLGAGWNETEYRAFDFAFDHRVSRFEEAFTIIRTLLRDGRIDFDGRFYQARDCELLPRGPRPGGPPLLLGSSGPRMLRIALPHVDAWNAWYADTGNEPAGVAPLRERAGLYHMSARGATTWFAFARAIVGDVERPRVVPIATAAFSQLKPELIGQATGLFNLLRNEGGSVGIALSATVLARHAQFHQARLTDTITPFNPILHDRLAATAHGLFTVSGQDPSTVKQMALGMIYGQVRLQATTMAYVDVFWMLTFAFVLFMPFILLLHGGKGRAPAGAH